jgi:SpoIIAA-like
MVETIADMPEGVIGLRASGKLTKEDYTGTLEPALKEAMDSGEARVVFVIEDYEGIEPSAAIEDIKTGLGVEFARRKDWKRLAVVTDIDWMAKAMHAFAWAMPGELRVYGMDEPEEAKSWAAG